MNLKPIKTGWRTYAACAALVVAGVAAAFGVHVSDGVITVIAGLGGIAGRAAISNNARKTAEDARALVQSLLAEVSVPEVTAVAAVKTALKVNPAAVSQEALDKASTIGDLKKILTDAAVAL